MLGNYAKNKLYKDGEHKTRNMHEMIKRYKPKIKYVKKHEETYVLALKPHLRSQLHLAHFSISKMRFIQRLGIYIS
jgi:hypothetical protein